MNTKHDLTNSILMIVIAAILIVTFGTSCAKEALAAPETIAPANIVDIYGTPVSESNDGAGLIHIVLGTTSSNLVCEAGTPQLIVTIQHSPTLLEPRINPVAPGNPCGDADWQAAESFAASLWLYIKSDGEEILVGPIKGLYTTWPSLYSDLVTIMDDNTRPVGQVFLPIIHN